MRNDKHSQLGTGKGLQLPAFSKRSSPTIKLEVYEDNNLVLNFASHYLFSPCYAYSYLIFYSLMETHSHVLLIFNHIITCDLFLLDVGTLVIMVRHSRQDS